MLVEVRLEREGCIVHNYGHGGSGITVFQVIHINTLIKYQTVSLQLKISEYGVSTIILNMILVINRIYKVYLKIITN